MKDGNMALAQEIKEIIDKGVLHACTTVNAIAALTYWRVGRRIVEEEQNGESRAEYGSRLLHSLSQELIPQYGESYNERNLRSYRQSFSLFPDFEIWYACVPNLSWTHIRQVLPVVNEDARYWYLREY